MSNLGGLGAYIPPGNFVNRYNVCIHFLYKNESESIFNDLHNTLHQITELLNLITFVLFYYFIKVHGRLSPLLFKSGGAIAPFAPLLLRLCMPKCTPCRHLSICDSQGSFTASSVK